MKKRWLPVLLVVLALGAAAALYYLSSRSHHVLVLTGIVTTDEVTVSSEIQGRLQQLLVNQGDTVQRGQLLAHIQPQEWKAEAAFYANTELQSGSQVAQAEADLKYQQAQSTNQIIQAEANLAAAKDQVTQAQADLANAQTNYGRLEDLYRRKVESPQAYDQARTTFESAKAHAASLQQQAQAAEAAVAIAKAERDRVEARRADYGTVAVAGGHGHAEADLDAEGLEPPVRVIGELLREGRQDARTGLDEDDARRPGIDIAEIHRQRVPSDLGNRAGHLNAGRAGPDDHEGQQLALLCRVAFRLGALEREQDVAADLGRVLERFQSGGVWLPVVVAKVGVARTGRDHKVVVKDPGAFGRIPQRDLAFHQIDARDLAEQNRHVLLPAENRPDRCRDLRR